ncbi:MAG: hypothetical protein E7072_11100, partial [Bacteroidales bacterium]|nr:hypothetical protein [Bacteroidales bacterium]
TTYYVRDLQGNVLAVYEHKHAEGESGTFTLAEQHLYGASRIGMTKPNLALNTTTPDAASPTIHYELTNHLGNVMAVITDEPAATETPAVESLTDYYPFGMTMPGRSYNAHTSRHGFTGHEKESDLAEGIYTTEYRLYDARVGRWLSVDPLFEKYVGISPYNYCMLNPVMMVDPDGRELKDIFKGAIAAINDNIMLGVGDYRGRMGRQAVDASDYNLGLIIGDGLSMLIGSGEMMSGIGMMAQGSAVVAVSVSGGVTAPVAVAGAGEIVAGAALAEHGYFMAAQGTSNLANKKGHLDESSKTTSSSGKGSSSAPAVRSKTLWKDGKGRRLDLENPNPGQRPGQLHVHDQKNKYIYKDGKLFGKNPKTGNYDVPVPREINKLLEDPQFQKAIQKGKEYLGE